MSMTEERKQYLLQYQKEKLKRVPLNLTLADYAQLQEAAAAAGASVNGFIKAAIFEKIQRAQPEAVQPEGREAEESAAGGGTARRPRS